MFLTNVNNLSVKDNNLKPGPKGVKGGQWTKGMGY